MLAGVRLTIDPDKSVRYESRRFSVDVTPSLVMLSKDSVLSLNLAFYREGDAVVWDVAGLALRQSDQHNNLVLIARLSAPEPSLPQGFQTTWSNAQSGGFPFNATVVNNNGTSTIRAIANGTPASAKVRYVLSVIREGSAPQASMTQQLTLLQHSFKALER